MIKSNTEKKIHFISSKEKKEEEKITTKVFLWGDGVPDFSGFTYRKKHLFCVCLPQGRCTQCPF